MAIHASLISINDDTFSPQALRVLQMAVIEASADRNQRGDKVCIEHILVAMVQEGENQGADLVRNCGITISELRTGVNVPKKADEA